MVFNRVYTDGITSPFDTCQWEKREVEVREENGKLVFINHDVEVPEFWSELATSILANKYFKRARVPVEIEKVAEDDIFVDFYRSVPKKGTEFTQENSLKQVVHRLVGTWTYWLIKSGLCHNEADAKVFYDELCYILIHQIAAPNSPQFFNTGLGWAYGIGHTDEGYYYFSEKTGKVLDAAANQKDSICRAQGHACYILGIEDAMFGNGSIYDTLLSEAKIFKRGSGAGWNASPLRGQNELLSNGGTSSGVMSFLRIFDRSADAVKSGGTTRRAAKMVSLDIDHPEIEEFINWKLVEEQKVASMISGAKSNGVILNEIIQQYHKIGGDPDFTHPELRPIIQKALLHNIELNYIKRAFDLAKQGYQEMPFVALTNNFNDDAYHTVSGQNSNNSVCLTDNFINAVHNNDPWNLIKRTDGKAFKTIDAKALWDKLVYAAWSSADPGVHFKDTMNSWNTCLEDGEIHASNPCSEYVFLDSTACNLGSLRLTHFFDESSSKFDVEKFKHVAKLMTIVLEMTVQSALLPTLPIAEGTYNYRTLGIGYTDAGALMMMQGIPYDSDRARAWFGVITALLTGEAYLTSAEMAKEVGAFARYEHNRNSMMRVIRNHARAVRNANSEEYEQMNQTPRGINADHCPEYLLTYAKSLWNDVITMGEQYGFRNAHVSCIAPTGTIGLLMSCDTTGIEPDFALVKHKKLAGGGYMKIINRMVPKALTKLGYTKEQNDDIVKYIIGRGHLPEIGAWVSVDSLTNSIPKPLNSNQISKIQDQLAGASGIEYVFNKYTLGASYCKEIGIDPEDFDDMSIGVNILSLMNFSTKEIEDTNLYVCGHQTIEGAPFVKEEHYPVFDCAVSSGAGVRSISYDAHLKALGAVQPFLSGATSKTVNMADTATMEDVERCYLLAHEYGIKCVALYRDGSKLSQPLNTLSKKIEFITEDESTIEVSIGDIYVAKRRKLPAKRLGQTHEFQIGPFGGPYHKIFLRTGEYEDGTLGEIFIDYAEEDAFARTSIGAFARSVSIGLQRGVPLEEYTSLCRSIAQDPSGQVLHPNVKVAKSIYDVVGKVIDFEYGKQMDAVEVSDMVEEIVESKVLKKHVEDTARSVIRDSKSKATLEKCPACGSANCVKEKSCELHCLSCGHKSGSCGG